MRIKNAVAAVRISIMKALIELFEFAAPTYDATYILSHLEKKFSNCDTLKLKVMIAEFVKFMYLRSQYNKGFIPLKGDIDDIWHEFILQTMEYEKFCQALPSGKFIHHNSLHLEEFSLGKEKKEVVRDLLMWLPNYYRHFGEFTEENAEYWMIVGFLQKERKLSLEEINQIAKKAHDYH